MELTYNFISITFIFMYIHSVFKSPFIYLHHTQNFEDSDIMECYALQHGK